ncbi:MAG: diaminopimelate decarboxylase [Bacilli bacterium]
MLTKSMRVINNELYVGKHKVSELAEAFSTPLYVYDEVHLRNKLDIFKNHFKSNKYKCETVYASKAFLAPYVCNIIKEYDMGIDSVSLGDLYLLEKTRFPMNKIVMHGNNKSIEELKYAVNHDIGLLVLDSLEETIELDELTYELGKDVNLLLRVNPGIEAHTHEYIKTSLLSSKFGESIFDDKKIEHIIDKCNDNPHMNLLGFHAHIGSNISNPESFVDEARTMMNFVHEVKEKYGFHTKVLNLGGGFGIKYLDNDPQINLELMLKMITDTVDQLSDEMNIKLDKLMIEPGRSIVGDAGFTVYKVGGTKLTYGGKKYVFVDGGMTDNIRPALYKAKYSAKIANKYNVGESSLCDVVGKCCESGDIIATDIILTDAARDDYLVTFATGAYGYSMASNYNGALKSSVVFVREGEVNMAIRKESLDDLVKTAVFENQKYFDAHCDVLYDLYKKKEAGVENRFTDFHVPQLLRSDVSKALWTIYSPDEFDLIEACKTALNEIDMSKLPDFEVILGLEGLRNLKKVEDIDILYNMGFRHAMLTWNEENQYATGAKADATHGLKDEGIKLLKRMQELDMIIDLAHLNEKSFYEALKVVNKNIVYSHGNIKALCDHPRNVTDDQMRALKAVDGVLGLTLANNFVSSNKEEQTLDNFIEHLKYAINIMGIDNVCFGFDFMDYLSEFPNSNLDELASADMVNNLTVKLRQAGFTDQEINKICMDNFYKRFKNKITLRG